MDDLRDCFKIAAVIMFGRLSTFHFIYLKGKMLPQNLIEPVHEISHYFTEQVVFILKEKIQRSCGHARLLTNPSQRCPHKSFIHKFLFGTLEQVCLCLVVVYLLSCHGISL